MKKIISLVLAAIMVMSCGIIITLADTVNSKLSERLQDVLAQSEPDDMIIVYLTYKTKTVTVEDMPSWPDISAARKELREYSETIQEEMQAKIFKGIEYTIVSEVMYSSVIVTLYASDIESIAQNELVRNIDYVDLFVPVEEEKEPENKPEHLYEDRFKNLYVSKYDIMYNSWGYDELYYHKDLSGEIDWILVKGYNSQETDLELQTKLGHRILTDGVRHSPFKTSYGVYDVKGDVFYAIDGGYNDEFVYSCDGLWRAYDEVGDGRLLGDMDEDNELSIIDVTIFQRCDIGMREFPADDKITPAWDLGLANKINLPAYYSDFNCDGVRDITDATAMQRYLVDIQE